MIRLGICRNPEDAQLIGEMGFDFIEVGLSWLHDLSDEEYARQLEIMKDAPIGVEACNGMLPGRVRVTGPDVDEVQIRAYLEKAFARAHEMGVKVVVFGSGAARGVPEGWPQDEAWRQIARYLTIAEEYCAKYDIEIAIEPLRRAECNIMNLVTEGTMMSALLNLPHIGTLGDTHHMLCGHEPFSALTQAGKLLKHVHISHSMGNEGGRDYPAPGDDNDYDVIFEALKAGSYDARVSIEAGCNDLAVDGAKAFEVLDALRKKYA